MAVPKEITHRCNPGSANAAVHLSIENRRRQIIASTNNWWKDIKTQTGNQCSGLISGQTNHGFASL